MLIEAQKMAMHGTRGIDFVRKMTMILAREIMWL